MARGDEGMNFSCAFCSKTFLLPRYLYDHWEKDHRELTKCYVIKNRATAEVGQVLALAAQEACQHLGWMIGDCFVSEIKNARSLSCDTPH